MRETRNQERAAQSHYDDAARAMWQARIDTVLAQGVSPIAEGAMQRWFTPEFRVDAFYIIVFFISSATVLAIVSFLWRHRSLLRFRFCTACGRQIPFDARLCPYCGHEFAP